MGILAIIGLIILAGIILAFIGAAFIGSALPLAGLFSAILSIIANWWMVWLPILIIGIIAYIARGRSNSSGSSEGVAAAIGATGGAAASEIMDRMEENNNSDDTTITDGNGFNTGPSHDSPTDTPTSIPRNNPPSSQTNSPGGNETESRTGTGRDTSKTQSTPTTRNTPRFPGQKPPNSRSADSSPAGGDSNINDGGKDNDMSDFSRELIMDLKDQINHLEKEEELEMEGIKEQRDAEQKLAEAMQGLNEERAVLEAIMYFNQIDMNQPQGQIHMKVSKFVQQSNKIGSAKQLLTEVEKVEEFMKEIEVAEKEIQDAESKMQQAVSDEAAVNEDMNEISQLMNQLQNGASKFQEWGLGRQ